MYNPTATQRDSAAYSKSPLLATALAALLGGMLGFSSIASAMEFSVYGSLRAGVNQSSTDGVDKANTLDDAGVINPTPAASDEETESVDTDKYGINNGGLSRFGVKGSEDLGNGMSAGFHFERGLYPSTNEHNHDDGEDAEVEHSLTLRHENVWIGGDWGKLTLGQQNNPYRAAANWDQSWLIGGNNRYDDGGSRISGIRYDSVALGPVRFALMVTEDDNNNGAQMESSMSVNDANDTTYSANTYTLTAPAVEDDDGIDLMIATLHYDIGDIATINLGLKTKGQESNVAGDSYDNTVISANGVTGPLSWYVAFEQNSDNFEESTIEAGGGAAAGDAGDQYFTMRNVAQDADTIGVFLAYSASDHDTLYLEYEDSGVDGVDVNLESLDKESILLGYTRAISSNTTFLVEYVTVDNASEYTADSSTLWAGLKVDF